jgi:uncharacterized protein YcaQ
MEPIRISSAAARKIVLDAQLLAGPADLPPGTAGLARIFERLGYVQIDTIHIVRRAHDHALWTRLPGYSDELLHRLQAVERGVFEYWAHAMSYLPLADFRFALPQMRQFRDPAHPRRQWLTAHEALPLAAVLDRIRAEGPLAAKDFEDPGGRRRGSWWEWKPAKSALELLFWQGDLMIAERRNFQKVYDLTERVLPPDADTRLPDEREAAEHVIRRSLAALGIAGAREIDEYLQPAGGRDSAFRLVTWDRLTRTLAELAESGAVVPAVVADGDTRYLLRETAERIDAVARPKAAVRILSPFDNLIIQRERTRRLFDFEYMLECYTPAPKRIYGYFVLPVLCGDRFAGRIDPQADRKSGTLILHSVILEKGFEPAGWFFARFAKALAAYAAFNGCRSVVIKKTRPANIRSALKSELKTLGF